ncbi:hypothetical protein C7974DRAFT_127528 [Boeremia exigua]|uniref:uncharacterized protein n=1 Tax=Boeremia exigua TaxID=749465 RepID=UPI001E8CFE4F|nr:uncharacterized protein C7974DRAFT_127528 [Boeremia exigua]KAH6639211.1 hypothetical protein C7974DRAFT_127528 [Boeremia exigua]
MAGPQRNRTLNSRAPSRPPPGRQYPSDIYKNVEIPPIVPLSPRLKVKNQEERCADPCRACPPDWSDSESTWSTSSVNGDILTDELPASQVEPDQRFPSARSTDGYDSDHTYVSGLSDCSAVTDRRAEFPPHGQQEDDHSSVQDDAAHDTAAPPAPVEHVHRPLDWSVSTDSFISTDSTISTDSMRRRRLRSIQLMLCEKECGTSCQNKCLNHWVYQAFRMSYRFAWEGDFLRRSRARRPSGPG